MTQKITVIGQKLAKEGNEFYFVGEMEECKNCKVRSTCLNLEADRRYRVKEIRSDKLLSCALHDEGVIAVFVEPAPILTLIDAKKAIQGAQLTYEPIKSSSGDKEYQSMINPEGLVKGDKCTIYSLGETVRLNGQNYKKAELLPAF